MTVPTIGELAHLQQLADAVVVGETWSPARAAHTLTTAGADIAYVVDDLGCVRGTVTIGLLRDAELGHVSRTPFRVPVARLGAGRRPVAAAGSDSR
ncbi:hypothetical protein [Dactylosporangium sp. NPDC000521]|uniref:hypothetical protein n=1 Tax=Dactylosporangium sp. NPDC000521 TaxID=3363975 RepID=UPI0036D08BD6